MVAGEGPSTVFAVAVMAVAVWALIEWFTRLSSEWQRIIDAELADRSADYAELTRAEAIVPELAAARLGGCSDCFED